MLIIYPSDNLNRHNVLEHDASMRLVLGPYLLGAF